ncbi:MAG TPA: hypothetical protein ENL08_04210 [Bacteroidetes bacterium]|nr:hypothetical protein [Bacteroidota bacterium]
MLRMIQLSSTKNGASVTLGGGAIDRLFDSVFILRPTLMFPLVTMVLAGHLGAVSSNHLGWESWFFLMIALCSLFGLGYLLNQVRDRKSDEDNGKLFLIAGGAINRSQVVSEIVVLAVLVPLMLFLAGFERLVVWILLMFLIGGLLYNFTPFALQNSPLGGLLAGMTGGWLLLRFGGTIAGGSAGLSHEAPYIIAFGSACILTCLLDKSGDAQNGKRTFAVVYGFRRTILFGLIGFLLAGIWGVCNRDWVITVPVLVSTPILLWGWLKGSIAHAVRANKIAIFSLSVAVGLFYPVYLVVIGLYYLFARWYYLRRMGLHYPSFRGD